MAYQQSLQYVRLNGPTNCAPLLAAFRDHTKNCMQFHQYQVLVLLTDGAITDFDQTKNMIIELSEYPCSVIIVGVGGANFQRMHDLDSDGQLLRNGGRIAKRDIVQFVEFNEAVRKGVLAEEVLKEMPNQVVDYAIMTGWKSNPVKQGLG